MPPTSSVVRRTSSAPTFTPEAVASVARRAFSIPAFTAGAAASADVSAAGFVACRLTLRTSPSWSRAAGPMPFTSLTASLSALMSAISPPRSSRTLSTASATNGRSPALSTSCSRVASCRLIFAIYRSCSCRPPLCVAEGMVRCNRSVLDMVPHPASRRSRHWQCPCAAEAATVPIRVMQAVPRPHASTRHPASGPARAEEVPSLCMSNVTV